MSASVAASRFSPWSRGGRSLLAASLALSALVIVAAWFLAAGRNDPGDQLVFVSLSLVGVVCEVSAVSRWIREGRRSVRGYRRELLGGLSASTPDVAVAAVASSDDLVARPQGRWIHRADCPFVGGRQWEPVRRGGRRGEGLQPCPGCRP